MNYIALSLICLTIGSTAFAADNAVKKKQLEELPLAGNPKKVIKDWEPIAYSEEPGRLSAGYRGVDSKKFYEVFKRKVEKVTKREYETSQEFTQRAADKDATLFPINTSDLYAFRIADIDMRYDADSQTYKMTKPNSYEYSCTLARRDKDWVVCAVASISRKDDTYIGTNAYGVVSRVTRTRGVEFALAIPKESPLLAAIPVFSVPLERARAFKNIKLAVLFVGRVSDAKLIKSWLRLEPTIDSPHDMEIIIEAVPIDPKMIICYVVDTGEILYKRSL